MADYNYSDINDAKRRVQEMKGRIRDKNAEERNGDIVALLSRIRSPRDKALIVALLYILNSEETDSELLLSIISLLL